MKRLTLQRDWQTDSVTMGTLSFNGSRTFVYTLEQEWRPTAPGGEPFNSCVPAATYKLIPHTRPDGRRSLALINPGVGVYRYEHDRPNGVGRYLILIHPGNTVDDVVGCIAPGMARQNEMVISSRHAMNKILEYVNDDECELTIRDPL